MKKIKIAIITSGELPVPAVKGGAVEKLVTAFSDINDKFNHFDLTIYSLWNDSLPESYSSTSYIYYKNWLYDLYRKMDVRIRNRIAINPYLNFVKKKIASENYDYIIIENRYSFVSEIASVTDSKIYLHMHNSHLLPVSERKKKALEKCDGILLVSEFLKKETSEAYPEFQSKMAVWYNGINVKKFNKNISEIQKAQLRSSVGIDTEAFVLTFVGRIVKEKGVLEVVRALKLLLDEIPQLTFLVVGTSWYAEGQQSEYVEKLKREASSIEKHIVFTGYVDNDDLPQYLHASDVLVYPSMWKEPFGLTIAEGLSTGKPTISFANGAIPELYRNCGVEANEYLICQSMQEPERAIADKVKMAYVRYKQHDGAFQVLAMQTQFSEQTYYERGKQLFV